MLHSPKNNLNLKIKTGTVTAPENVMVCINKMACMVFDLDKGNYFFLGFSSFLAFKHIKEDISPVGDLTNIFFKQSIFSFKK